MQSRKAVAWYAGNGYDILVVSSLCELKVWFKQIFVVKLKYMAYCFFRCID